MSIMSKFDKLLLRIKSKLKDFTYKELTKLLTGLGYNEVKKGKTAGSRVAFFNSKSKHIIRLHKPHPANILKAYQIEYLIEELKKFNLL